ncbi:MAG: hypothetical protein A2167_00710 [Planctomycetes bacterium RBG_13_46_10]|nr:MAG: hypothetical protein A2167_00710 [Planctomycetes bacterium RBG_13_46_10]
MLSLFRNKHKIKAAMDDLSKKKTDLAYNRSIMRWRTVTGILFGLTLYLIFVIFSSSIYAVRPPIETYPWLKYPFTALLFLTIIVFNFMWKKEQNILKNDDLQNSNKYKIFSDSFGSFTRTILCVLVYILSFVTVFFFIDVEVVKSIIYFLFPTSIKILSLSDDKIRLFLLGMTIVLLSAGAFVSNSLYREKISKIIIKIVITAGFLLSIYWAYSEGILH